MDLDLVRPPPPDNFLGDLAPPLLLASNNFLVSLTVSGAGNSRSLTPNNNPADTGFIGGAFVGAGVIIVSDPNATLCRPGRPITEAAVGLEDLRAATDCLASRAADFLAGRTGEPVAAATPLVIWIFSLTRAGLEESTWFTGGGGGSTFESLQQNIIMNIIILTNIVSEDNNNFLFFQKNNTNELKPAK